MPELRGLVIVAKTDELLFRELGFEIEQSHDDPEFRTHLNIWVRRVTEAQMKSLDPFWGQFIWSIRRY